MIRWLEKNRYAAIILTILIAIEIFYFSSISMTSHGQAGIGLIPIIYHLTVFFLFNFFLLISIKGNKKIKISYLIIALGISIIYALSDEFHQIFILFRNASIQDILIDTIGIFLSTIFILYFNKKR